MKTNLLNKTIFAGFLTLTLLAALDSKADVIDDIQGYYQLIPGHHVTMKDVGDFARCNQVEGIMAVKIKEPFFNENYSQITMKNNFTYVAYPFDGTTLTETERNQAIAMKSYKSQPPLYISKDKIEQVEGPMHLVSFNITENKVLFSEKLERGLISVTRNASVLELYNQKNNLQVSTYSGFITWDVCNYKRITAEEYSQILAARK